MPWGISYIYPHHFWRPVTTATLPAICTYIFLRKNFKFPFFHSFCLLSFYCFTLLLCFSFFSLACSSILFFFFSFFFSLLSRFLLSTSNFSLLSFLSSLKASFRDTFQSNNILCYHKPRLLELRRLYSNNSEWEIFTHQQFSHRKKKLHNINRSELK